MKIYNWETCPWSDTEFLWHLEVIFMVPISEASGMCSDNMLANKVITVKVHFLMLFSSGQSIFSEQT